MHVMRQVECSLRRLKTDYIDVYYAHHPDPLTRIEETLQTFEDLVRQGKIRYYALSTYGEWQLTEAVLRADQLGLRRPVCHQTRYNVADRWVETDVLPASRHFGISIFSPLAGGLLAGVAWRPSVHSSATRLGRKQIQRAAAASRRANYGSRRILGSPSGGRCSCVLLAQAGVSSVIIGTENAAELRGTLPAAELKLDQIQVAQVTELGPDPPGFWD